MCVLVLVHPCQLFTAAWLRSRSGDRDFQKAAWQMGSSFSTFLHLNTGSVQHHLISLPECKHIGRRGRFELGKGFGGNTGACRNLSWLLTSQPALPSRPLDASVPSGCHLHVNCGGQRDPDSALSCLSHRAVQRNRDSKRIQRQASVQPKPN